jgi:hypothetical protein
VKVILSFYFTWHETCFRKSKPKKRYFMKTSCLRSILGSTLVAVMGVSAAPIVPTYTTFGLLTGATFSGTGIPNHAVAITTIGGVTLGLTAHQRYTNPPVLNNGAGIFYAVAGADIYSSPSQPTYARWNFGWYFDNPSPTLTLYVLELLYDFDPATGTDESQLGKFSALLPPGKYEDSWNLGMPFLSVPAITNTPVVVSVSPPSYPSFNPAASGEYSFALILKDLDGNELGRSAILVRVVPDTGAGAVLLAVSMAGLAWLRRRV